MMKPTAGAASSRPSPVPLTNRMVSANTGNSARYPVSKETPASRLMMASRMLVAQMYFSPSAI